MNHTALITGASRGIGKACAQILARHFDTIILNSCHHPDELATVKEDICEQGTRCLTYCGDIGDYNFVHSMMTDLHARGFSIDLLVNNAGVSYVGLLTDMSIDDWNSLFQTNVTSVFNCCHEVIPDMLQKKSGHIINISSMWGISGASCEVAYSATKGAINAFTKALAKELAPSNIRVNAIACGAIATQMNACFTPEELTALSEDIPMGRLGTPKEVANMVWQLYESPLYLTGEVIKLDGGYL